MLPMTCLAWGGTQENVISPEAFDQVFRSNFIRFILHVKAQLQTLISKY
jgi:hypothetical protein